MKQYQIIYEEDWPELLALNTEHRALHKKYGPTSWAHLFKTKKHAEARARISEIVDEYEAEIRAKLKRKIPIGRNPADYEYHVCTNSTLEKRFIQWGQK